MSRPKPEKLIVEFDDGSAAEIAFSQVPWVLQEEIQRQPFVCKKCGAPAEGKFVMIEWRDGWKEVVAVPDDCEQINRYRVIVRPEEVGRLSLSRPDGYPELVEIHRRPAQVERITFGGTFALEQTHTLREGKKQESYYQLKEDQDSLSAVKADLEAILAEQGVGADVFGSIGEQERDRCETVCRLLGLRAGQRQQDVVDFLGTLLNGRN